MKQDVRIGLIGTGFMGKSHAMAYQAVPFIFPSAARPVGELVADVSEEAAVAGAVIVEMSGPVLRPRPQ
jgi:predicted dehydrogenase